MKSSFRIDRNKLRLSIRYGTEREKKCRFKGPWPRGNSAAAMDLDPFNLVLSGQKDILAGRISHPEQIFLRSLTLQFSLKEKHRSHHCKTGTPDSPYLAISDIETDESFVIARKSPFRQIVRFSYSPRRRLIRIRWQFNRMIQAETPLELDHVYIRFGNRKDLLSRLTKDIARKHPFDDERTQRTLWIPPLDSSRGIRLKTLENNLAVLEKNRIFYDQIRLDGLHPVPGDWLTIQKDFRGKIGFLTRRIEHSGMTPALSFSPLSVSPESEIYRQHPEWLMENLKGDPLLLMDITQDAVRDYLKNALETFRNQWGFRSFHLKGLALLAQPHLKKNNAIESGSLIRKTLQFFKENIGKEENLSTEGMAYMAGSGWINHLETVKASEQRPNAPEMFKGILHTCLQNASLQKKLWLNNPGVYPFGSEAESLPGPIRESIRQIILLNGGILTFNVDHSGLTEEALEEIGKIMETFRPFCRGELIPLKYAGNKRPAVLYNTEGHLGVFNLSPKKQSISLKIEDLKVQVGTNGTAGVIREGQTGMKTGSLDLILPPYGSRIFRF